MKKLTLTFFLIILLCWGVLYGLLSTTGGIHFLIKNIIDWIPGLSIQKIEGQSRDLTLKGIEYRTQGLEIKAEQIHLALNFFCETSRPLCLDDFTLNDLKIMIDIQKLPSTETASDEPLNDLQIPYPLLLKNLRLKNLTLTVDNTQISLTDFRTQADWHGRTLSLISPQISRLLVNLPKNSKKSQGLISINASKSSDKTPPIPAKKPFKTPFLNEKLHQDLVNFFAHPILPALPDFHLPLDIQIKKLNAEQLQIVGDEEILIHSLQLQAITQQQHFELDELKVDLPFGSFSASGNATFSDHWPIALKINSLIKIPPLKEEKIQLRLEGELQKELALTADLSGTLNAQLNATTTLSQVGLPIQVALISSQLQWPLTGAPEYKIEHFKLKFNGKATDYTLSLKGDIKSKAFPPALLTLDGQGNLQKFHLTLLRLAVLEGLADLSGQINWSKAIRWNGVLTLKGINTKTQWPEWPFQFNGKISSSGRIDDENWRLEIPDLLLEGQVQKKTFKISGSLKGNMAGQWNIPSFDVAFGQNKLNIQGDLSEQSSALNAHINAPKLEDGLPNLAGSLKGALTLRGHLKKPQLHAHLIARHLKWQNLSIEKINLKTNLHSSDQIKGELGLQVEKLKQADFSVDHLILGAKGTEKKHQFTLDLQGNPISANVTLQGYFNRQKQIWDAKLNKTDIRTLSWDWHLNHSTGIQYFYSAQKMIIQPHCWQNPKAQICIPHVIEAEKSGVSARAHLNQFDLALLKPFLSAETTLSGNLTGDAQMKWTLGNHFPTAALSLMGHDIKIRQNIENNPLNIVLETLTFGGQLSQNQAQINTLISLKNNGQMQGDIQVSDLQGTRALSGKIDIHQISLAPINTVLDKNEKIKGMLKSHLRISGSLKKPLVKGDISLNNFALNGSWMPVIMTPSSHLLINFEGTQSTLKGIIATKKGQITLLGNANWDRIDDWKAHISAKGEDVRVTPSSEIQLDISPDILFEAKPKLLILKGLVKIPWARIKVDKIPPNVVNVSSYEVMLNDQREPIMPQKAQIPIKAYLNLEIGEDVGIDAFGLQAKLQGILKVQQDQHGLGLHGQVNIPSGSFHVYGQDLLIKKGLLLFSGSPKPLLNIEAIRNPEAITPGYTAGIRVTGNTDSPKIEIFSDPVLPQQEALSYLLRGQGTDQSGTDNNVITSMLISLSISQTGSLIGKIGGAFGISQLALDTQGIGNSSQVVVSGYLTKDLQLKYGVGIFDSLATLTLRYRLMPSLYLEAISGLDQALDLLYQFEFQ